MEVLSPTTESYDRGEKMELYRQQEIEEYWIVDWRKKKIEIYEKSGFMFVNPLPMESDYTGQ